MTKTRLAFSALTSALLLSVSLPAFAQEEDAAEADGTEGPKMDLSVAPPSKPLQRDAYMHNGFYLRASAGGGYQHNNFSGGGTSDAFAVGADLLVGGSPSPGLALGGGAINNIGVGSNSSFNFTVGPFFDAYPQPNQGLHYGALVGFTGATASGAGFMAGGGGAAWLGYDAWVAPEFSAGFKLRVGGSYAVGDPYDVGAFNAMLLITLLNH